MAFFYQLGGACGPRISPGHSGRNTEGLGALDVSKVATRLPFVSLPYSLLSPLAYPSSFPLPPLFPSPPLPPPIFVVCYIDRHAVMTGTGLAAVVSQKWADFSMGKAGFLQAV